MRVCGPFFEGFYTHERIHYISSLHESFETVRENSVGEIFLLHPR